MNFLEHYTKEQIEEWVSQSTSAREVLLRMGRSANSGSNTLALSVYLRENNIDTSHFAARSTPYTPKEIFIENSTATQSVLRKYYSKGNYTAYKCAICGLEPIWNQQALTLRLDHINGVSNDHRLENLRWICPNCDSQLPTYGAKRKKQVHQCAICGVPISRQAHTGLCVECYWQQKREQAPCAKEHKQNPHIKASRMETVLQRINLSPLQFAKHIILYGFSATGRQFGVTPTTIRKYCAALQLPTTLPKLQEWYQQQIPQCSMHKIQQIDIATHNVIAEYATYSEAQRAIGAPSMGHISRACQGKQKSAYGFAWREIHNNI